MADFDGENVLSDDEIARLTSAPAAATAQQGMSQERMQRHLTSLADEGYKDAQRGAYAWLRIHCLGTLYYTMYNTHMYNIIFCEFCERAIIFLIIPL